MSTDARLAKARERIERNLTDPAHIWTRQLSALFGVNPDVALAALRGLVDDGAIVARIAGPGHEYRLD